VAILLIFTDLTQCWGQCSLAKDCTQCLHTQGCVWRHWTVSPGSGCCTVANGGGDGYCQGDLVVKDCAQLPCLNQKPTSCAACADASPGCRLGMRGARLFDVCTPSNVPSYAPIPPSACPVFDKCRAMSGDCRACKADKQCEFDRQTMPSPPYPYENACNPANWSMHGGVEPWPTCPAPYGPWKQGDPFGCRMPTCDVCALQTSCKQCTQMGGCVWCDDAYGASCFAGNGCERGLSLTAPASCTMEAICETEKSCTTCLTKEGCQWCPKATVTRCNPRGVCTASGLQPGSDCSAPQPPWPTATNHLFDDPHHRPH